MRTINVLLIGALVALAAVGVVAAQQASSASDSGSGSATDSGSDVPAAHAGHICPLHDKAAAATSRSSSASGA